MPVDFVQQGKALLQKREFAEVVRVCRTGLLTRPGAVDGRLLLATALLALRRYDEALADLRVAGEIDADNKLVHLLKGEALLKKGDAESAAAALARAVELDPENKVAKKLHAEARSRAGLDDPSRAVLPPVVKPADAPAPAQETEKTRKAPRPGRRRAVIAAAALVALAGGGTAAYLHVRSQQAEARLGGLKDEAARAAALQTYRGVMRANELYAKALAGGDAGAAGPLARLRAQVDYEMGVTLPGAAVDGGNGRDGQLATVYKALAAGDVDGALRQATALESGFPEDGEVAYVAGRARFTAREATALETLRRAVTLSPTPLARVALAEAEAAAGNAADGLRALDAALEQSPGHPAALIARARLLAASGKLAADDPGGEAALARMAAEKDDAVTPPVQRRLAALALAEVKLARGEPEAARDAVDAAGAAGDGRFVEAKLAALLALGDLPAARDEIATWRTARPMPEGAPDVWAARVALAEENLEAARALLTRAGDAAGESFAGRVARGEVELLAGNLPAAATELDKALALRAGDRGAQLLRVRVDLDAGDAAAAEARLSPLYEAGHDPVVGSLYGEALRRRGDRARARKLLEEATLKLQAAAARPSLAATATLALARLDSDEGRLADAQKAIEQVLSMRPQDVPARLLQARVLYDLGDVSAARETIDTLVVAAHAHPAVVIEAARLHSASGDRQGAQGYLDEAAKLPGAPAADLARESARLALADGRADDAVSLLSAGGTTPVDAEGWMILLDARLAGGAAGMTAAEAVTGEIARRFPGRAEESLAAGKLQLARKDGAAAATSFATALSRLEAAGTVPRQLAETRTLLGQAQEMAGKPDDAFASYTEAARIAPGAPRASFHLGRMLLAKGDAAGANEALARSVKSDPGDPEAQFRLAESAVALKKTAVAKQALETYLKLAPRGPYAERAHKMLAQ